MVRRGRKTRKATAVGGRTGRRAGEGPRLVLIPAGGAQVSGTEGGDTWDGGSGGDLDVWWSGDLARCLVDVDPRIRSEYARGCCRVPPRFSAWCLTRCLGHLAFFLWFCFLFLFWIYKREQIFFVFMYLL